MPISLAQRSLVNMSEYSNSKADWVQFVHDHRAHILSQCSSYAISPESMNAYQYRPLAYLSSIGFPMSMAWIVLWINNIDPQRFIHVQSLQIPSQSTITRLYQSYVTSANTLSPGQGRTVRTTVGI